MNYRQYYPAMVLLEGRPCVLIGGGDVAEQKLRPLLKAGGKVRVIAQEVRPEIEALADRGVIELVKRSYQPGDLAGAFLVVAATDEEEVNRAVFQEADSAGILVNVVDRPDLCNFVVPSVVDRWPLQVAISTSGCSPALSRRLRRELSKQFGAEYSEFTALLGELRPEVLAKVPAERLRRRVFTKMAYTDVLQLLRKGLREEAKQRLVACLSDASD